MSLWAAPILSLAHSDRIAKGAASLSLAAAELQTLKPSKSLQGALKQVEVESV
jgi:hypothetical protein